ncbi:ATP synthase F1 subunit gamma [Chitinasiproducens palmae]|uniref:ATP synthase gamma chain n=1 Tax=Chitinasiproducens palmae TaxID=1770053 RepID=A0A1H2PKT6_9BURK|nr:ATP synthase F1 subunit gamma [Chitinasiproducens palmae]SDV46969.1 F-type H+-transporting ATPase subunit gamma [Chitinasiproducens palmae]
MHSPREVKNKITSVLNTRKITRAMQMIASIKMAGAQRRMRSFRAYGESARRTAKRLADATPDYQPPLMARRPLRRVGLIVVTTDKGLCGALNVRLLQACVHRMREWEQRGAAVRVTVIGGKGLGFMRRTGADLMSSAVDLGEPPAFDKLLGAITEPIIRFVAGELDELHIASNRFENTLAYEPQVECMLPLPAFEADAQHRHPEPPIFEPAAKPVVDTVLLRYLESMIYQAVVENSACEQCARMVAMKAASDNATRVADELTLLYHRTRQAAITQEINEIVAGAAAV